MVEAEKALIELLQALFTQDELRRFLYLAVGHEVVQALPQHSSLSMSGLAFESVMVLERRGQIASAFFESLQHERPARAQEIAEIAQLWNVQLETSAKRDEVRELLEDLSVPARPLAEYRSSRIESLSHELELVYMALEAGRAKKPEQILLLSNRIRALREQLHEDATFQPGELLVDGRYLLLSLLGRGGYGTVWRGWDRHFRRDVAMKLLSPEWTGEKVIVERFLHTARLLAGLPNKSGWVEILTPQLRDFGNVGYVMEFMPGGNLEDAVLDGRIDSKNAISIILSCADALDVAHRQGLIHLNLKPSNVLLGSDGEPRLTDAQEVRIADTTGGTRTVALGSFTYVAPEVMEEPRAADVRADVYSLGMIAIFCLAGKMLPLQVFRDPDGFISTLGVPSSLLRALQKAVQWSPEERFASTEEFAEALKAVSGSTRGFVQSGLAQVLQTERTAVANPFQPSTALPSGEIPPGRFDEVKWLLDRIAASGSAVIIGPRRSGKTSLLRHLRTRLRSSHSIFFVDLQSEACERPVELVCALAPGVPAQPQSVTQFRDMLRQKERGSPILLVDEVGFLRKADLSVQPTMFGWLRGIGHQEASIIYAGSRRDWAEALKHAQKEPGSSFGNDVPEIRLGPLSEPAALTFLRDTAPPDVPLDENRAGRWIIDRCGTWPFYLQVMGHTIVEEVRAGRTALLSSAYEYDDLYTEHLLLRYSNMFQSRWRELPRLAQAVILTYENGLPDYDELPPDARQAVREADLYEGLRKWTLVDDLPFLDWIRRMRTELRDELDMEDR